jgi:predicted HTH transcriptional regulator
MTTQRKTIKEEFAQFYEDPTREGLRELLRDNLGEFPNLDFKEQWPAFPKLARHLLGLANLGGGCIIIGVAEKEDKSLESVGIDDLIDKSSVTNGIKKFLPNTLLENIDIGDFKYEVAEYPKLIDKKFQTIFVTSDAKHLPFVAMADGDGIRNNAIYTRRGPSTEEANYDELQNIINRRLETGYSSQGEIDLRTHIEQLKTLYGQIDQYHIRREGGIADALQNIATISLFGETQKILNPVYPPEGFDMFIARMIEKKKKRIEIILDVIDLSMRSDSAKETR